MNTVFLIVVHLVFDPYTMPGKPSQKQRTTQLNDHLRLAYTVLK